MIFQMSFSGEKVGNHACGQRNVKIEQELCSENLHFDCLKAVFHSLIGK